MTKPKNEFPFNSVFESANITAPPSAQEILSVEQALIECLKKKKQVDRQLLELEIQLYHYETSYLEKYHQANLIKGFDIASFTSSNVAPATPVIIQDQDRLFSNSSNTFHKALALKEKMTHKMIQHQTQIASHDSDEVFAEDDDLPTTARPVTKASSSKGPTAASPGMSQLSRRLQKNRDALQGSTAGVKAPSSLLKKSYVPNTPDSPRKVLRIRTRIHSPS